MDLRLNLRSRVQDADATGRWIERTAQTAIPAGKTALLLCDVWDKHWCASAQRRCGELAKRMARVVESARANGVFIIHAPSDCMDFYADTPQRKRMQAAHAAEPPAPRAVEEPPLPIDDSDGGCDDSSQCLFGTPWTRQDAAIQIADEDGISDNGDEVYNALRQRGIETLLIMGVHTNMCVLKRSFAIRAMVRRGMDVVLVRDLTDTMYNPRMEPRVSHDEGTRLVVEHIEQYLCPTILSKDLLESPV